jgi:stage IV sporulation protein FB
LNDTINNESDSNQTDFSGVVYPPKPILAEKKENAALRSLISLVMYGVLFYFLFDRNISYIAAVLLVIIIHEMGHFAFMKLFNYSNVRIFIIPLLGAFTSGKKQQVSQRQLSLIILGGPVPGIIIGCILFWINIDLNNDTLRMLYRTFLVINLLNCLPFYPLDGGRLIETLFFKENHIIRLVFGILSIMALLVLFILISFSPFLLIIPVFIALELYTENKHEKIREYLRQEKINYYIEFNDLPDKNYWLIRDCLLLSFPKKYAGTQVGNYQYSASEPVIVKQITAVLKVNLKFDLNTTAKIGLVLFYVAIFVLPITLFVIYRG